MPPKKSDRSHSTGFPLGFEAAIMRDSAIQTGEANLRSLSTAKDNLWLSAGGNWNNASSFAVWSS